MAASGLSRHTIVLLQTTASPSSRTFYDFESKTKAVDGVVRLFEEALKRARPTASTLTYDVADVFTFLDGLGDIVFLVLDPASGKYEPFSREYVKQHVFLHIRDMAK